MKEHLIIVFAMNKITQAGGYRQSLINCAQNNGITKAEIRYRTNRQYICRWMKRCNSTAITGGPFPPSMQPPQPAQVRRDQAHRRHAAMKPRHRAGVLSQAPRTRLQQIRLREDFQKQLAVWQYRYNDFPMCPLNWYSPKQVHFFTHCVTHHWQACIGASSFQARRHRSLPCTRKAPAAAANAGNACIASERRLWYIRFRTDLPAHCRGGGGFQRRARLSCGRGSEVHGHQRRNVLSPDLQSGALWLRIPNTCFRAAVLCLARLPEQE